MSTSSKLCLMLVAVFTLAGCKPRETHTPHLPPKPVTCNGTECEAYVVRRYENLPSFMARGTDGRVYERLGFRIVLETSTVRLNLTCDQAPLLPPPPACGQGMLLAGETVWARRGPSGNTFYVYSNNTPQHKQTVSLWVINSSEAK